MTYREFQPHPALRQYVDAYWVSTSSETNPRVSRILPDGCIDIILNIGDDFKSGNERMTVLSGKKYLVGTMTHFIDVVNGPNTNVMGIRFKPLGFSNFYKFSSLDEISNKTILFDDDPKLELQEFNASSVAYLDRHLLEKLSPVNHQLTVVLDEIKSKGGRISVGALSKSFGMSSRKLERIFKYHVGLTPKEHINFVRYQYAVSLIRQKRTRSLLDIAFSSGYYDHSHLTNSIRQYSGLTPSLM